MWRAEVTIGKRHYGADGKTESEAKRNLQDILIAADVRGEHVANTFQWQPGPSMLGQRFSR